MFSLLHVHVYWDTTLLHWIASDNMETAPQMDLATGSPRNLLLVSKEFTQHKQWQTETSASPIKKCWDTDMLGNLGWILGWHHSPKTVAMAIYKMRG